jgi:hypothetical protein
MLPFCYIEYAMRGLCCSEKYIHFPSYYGFAAFVLRFAKYETKQVSLFRKSNRLFREISLWSEISQFITVLTFNFAPLFVHLSRVVDKISLSRNFEKYLFRIFKGTVSRDFWPSVFSLIDYIFSNSVSNSPCNSIANFCPALCDIALDKNFSLGSPLVFILFGSICVRKFTYERFFDRLFL